MKHAITHTTHYRYSLPVNYTIQLLRMTPRQDAHQRVLKWRIDTPGDLQPLLDAFGNVTHTLTLTEPHDAIHLKVSGQVDVQPLHDGQIRNEDSRLPVAAFCVPTRLTQSDDSIRAFCADSTPNGVQRPADVLTLAQTIQARVAYVPGTTDVTTMASEVLQQGRGVCQDHTHLFLACAHSLGLPARYVSGYLYTEAEHAASHAWCDIWLDGHGWISVDVTNGQFASDRHCRLAVARDYDSASPVRGVRTGGGVESMDVKVHVDVIAQ